MNFRAKWFGEVERPVDPPQTTLFGNPKTEKVRVERHGWVVGATHVGKDVEGITYSSKECLAILPDGETTVIFVQTKNVEVSIHYGII